MAPLQVANDFTPVAHSPTDVEDVPLLEKGLLPDAEETDGAAWLTSAPSQVSRRKRTLLAYTIALVTLTALLVVGATKLRGGGALDDAGETSISTTFQLPTSISEPTEQTRYVPIWRSAPFEEEGWVKKPVELPQAVLKRENKTELNSVFRSAIVVPSSDPDYITIRAVAAFWAFPLDSFETIHARGPALLDRDADFRLEVFTKGRDSEAVQARLHRYDWKYVDFRVSTAELPLDKVAKDARRIPIRFSLQWEGKTSVAFEVELQQTWAEYTRQAICLRPLYGGFSPLQYKEWRLHSAAMGFDVVHWGSRSPKGAKDVERLNRLTGLRDTFTYFPRYEPRADNPFWEEHFTNNDCYSAYSTSAEFMGVWDVDEMFAPALHLPWTREYVEQYLDELDPEVTAVNLPWFWVDKGRFESVPEARLLEQQPDLSRQDLQDIASLSQNGNGIYAEPDGGVYFTTKSLYRTNLTIAAQVHHGTPCCGMSQSGDVRFAVYHARKHAKLWEGYFKPYEVSPSIVNFWKDLGARLRMLESL